MNLLKKFFKHALVIAILGYPIYHLLHTLHVLNPLEKELADFKFTDIYFGHFQKSKLDTNIYFLDVGVKDNTTTRSEISSFINNVNKKYKPKVIAIDVQFFKDTLVSEDVNANLVSSIRNDNIVLGYDLINHTKNKKWYPNRSELPFNYNIIKEGYLNNLVAKTSMSAQGPPQENLPTRNSFPIFPWTDERKKVEYKTSIRSIATATPNLASIIARIRDIS